MPHVRYGSQSNACTRTYPNTLSTYTNIHGHARTHARNGFTTFGHMRTDVEHIGVAVWGLLLLSGSSELCAPRDWSDSTAGSGFRWGHWDATASSIGVCENRTPNKHQCIAADPDASNSSQMRMRKRAARIENLCVNHGAAMATAIGQALIFIVRLL